MQPNQQPVEKQTLTDDGTLHVQEVWYTIQGEGPFAGEPAIFVRLSGCNLKCPLCDTDYTSVRGVYKPSELLEKVLSIRSGHNMGSMVSPRLKRHPLVVITGGEPFRQNIVPFVRDLLDLHFRVQIETNGTLFIPGMMEFFHNENFFVVCSPKTPHINTALVPYITAFKYVVEYGKVSEIDGLPTSVLGMKCSPARPPEHWTPRFLNGGIYVQPVDTQEPLANHANTLTAVESCMKFGYTLCIQNHKQLGLK